MKRTICLVIIFFVGPGFVFLGSLVLFQSFGFASRRAFGCERIGSFSISLGDFSVIKRGCGMGGDDFVEMDRP